MEETSRKWRGNTIFRGSKNDSQPQYYVKNICEYCGEGFFALLQSRKRGNGRFCSKSCSGKSRAEEEDLSGENNPNWKGGVSENHYERNKEEYIERAKKARERNKKFMDDYRKERQCEDCGEEFFRCLELHHRNRDEKFKGVGQMVEDKYSIERIKQEIEKCDLICSNCHKKRHYKSRD